MQVASFLLYLSDVEEGGETMFPFEACEDIVHIICSLHYVIILLTDINFVVIAEWLASGFRL